MTADLTGRVYGRLEVLGPDASIGLIAPGGWWRCRCACGAELVTPGEGLTSGRVASCGRPSAGTGAAQAAMLANLRPPPRL